MQMQPYARPEPIPVPPPGRNSALAERTGYNGTNGYAGSANGHTGSTNGKMPQSAPTSQPTRSQAPTYLQVLIEQIQKRLMLLGIWLAVTAVVAFAVIKTLGKPAWRAEGALYYQPDYTGQHSLYRPPNIQSVVRDIKSPDVLEALIKEKNIGMTSDALQKKITAAVVKNSDYISVSFDWPNAGEASAYANRLLELVVIDHDVQRQKKSKNALEDLDERLKKTIDDELSKKKALNDILANKNIFDLPSAKSGVQSEISQYQSQIIKYEGDISESKLQIEKIDKQIEKLKDFKKKQDGPLTPEQLSLLSVLKDTKRAMAERTQKKRIAEVQLKAKLAERELYLPIYRKGAMSRQEWNKLEAEIAEQRILANGTEELRELDNRTKELEQQIMEAPIVVGKINLTQLNLQRYQAEINLEVLPKKIEELNGKIGERRKWQQHLQSVEKETLPIQQAIDAAQQDKTNLTTQRLENEKLSRQSGELMVSTKATVGESPVSSNHAKLAMAVVGLSMLGFVGLIAVRDMPQALKTARTQFVEEAAPAPRSDLPVPWAHQAVSTELAPRGPSPEQSSEHLRALATRITQNISDRGSIVLFTPAANGLRIETLVGDLGCYCAQLGGRVLVFDTRPPLNGSASIPAWAGPAAGDVGVEVENFLMGHADIPSACFASTLITSIDYSRGDIFSRLNGVLANHRFRKLVEEMRNSYSLVLLITPDMYCGGEDDFLSNLAEGVVVVLNESTDPADVDAYVQNLRANETPVYGAVTVPGRA